MPDEDELPEDEYQERLEMASRHGFFPTYASMISLSRKRMQARPKAEPPPATPEQLAQEIIDAKLASDTLERFRLQVTLQRKEMEALNAAMDRDLPKIKDKRPPLAWKDAFVVSWMVLGSIAFIGAVGYFVIRYPTEAIGLASILGLLVATTIIVKAVHDRFF